MCSGLAAEVSKWLYQPLRINGEPVAMVTELGIVFNLPPIGSGTLLTAPKFPEKGGLAVVGL